MSRSDEPANSSKSAEVTDDSKKQNQDDQAAADAIDSDDPHKVEKLSKLGHADNEAAEGTE